MNEIIDLLGTELERLAAALERHAIPLIIGGGYGLLLRQRTVQQSGARTVREIPAARSTNDLDIFLAVEVITNAVQMGALRDVLQTSGYSSVAGAEHYQFRKGVTYNGSERQIKVDLLGPPPRDPERLKRVRVDERRIRNRDVRGIHAHTTPEAFAITEGLTPLEITASPSTHVWMPHPYAFLLLKIFAYRDRRRDPAMHLGRHHAFDIYRIIAMMTEDDYQTAERLRDRFVGDEIVDEARRIVAELFAHLDSQGTLAVLENAQSAGVVVHDRDMEGFVEDLRTFFPEPG